RVSPTSIEIRGGARRLPAGGPSRFRDAPARRAEAGPLPGGGAGDGAAAVGRGGEAALVPEKARSRLSRPRRPAGQNCENPPECLIPFCQQEDLVFLRIERCLIPPAPRSGFVRAWPV